MEGIKRVMACIDLSDYSKMTIDYTLGFTTGLKAEILLFNVINSREIDAVKTVNPHLPQKINVESYIERVKSERRKKIEEMLQELIEEMLEEHCLPDQVNMDIIIRVGMPHKEILNAIETEKIDVVIIANKGRSNLIGTLHGSNAEKIFRQSPVPVLSVRDRERFIQNRLGGIDKLEEKQ